MITIQPLQALRPRKDVVHLVAAKPYDVLNSEEAKEEAPVEETSETEEK